MPVQRKRKNNPKRITTPLFNKSHSPNHITRIVTETYSATCPPSPPAQHTHTTNPVLSKRGQWDWEGGRGWGVGGKQIDSMLARKQHRSIALEHPLEGDKCSLFLHLVFRPHPSTVPFSPSLCCRIASRAGGTADAEIKVLPGAGKPRGFLFVSLLNV